MEQHANRLFKDGYLIEAFYLETDAGRLFSLYTAPESKIKASIIFIPPFMEEMNRSRDLVAKQARAFAEMGYAILTLDLYGTGDSEGDLIDADWSLWKQNVLSAANWLREKNGRSVLLWGLRLGCLIAADLADEYPDRFKKLLLWQPVFNGKQYLTQILRLRMVYLVSHDLPPEKTVDMRKRLQEGDTVEIAGYPLPGQLGGEIDALKITDFKGLGHCRIDWFENIVDTSDTLSVAVQKTIEELQKRGAAISVYTYQSPQFWQMTDRVMCPDLIEKTSKVYRCKYAC